jgi:CBS domain-containing protein
MTTATADAAGAPIMRIRDRAEFKSKPRPLTFRGDTSVAEAVAAMSEKNYGSVIVVDADDRVEGVVTERDVLRKLVNEGRAAGATTLADIMTAEPRVAREDDDVVDWLRIMSNERFRRLPVVDAEGRIQAVFTQGDFVSYTWPDLMGQAREMAKATVLRNWHIFLIGGGIMLYTVLIVLILP